MQFTMPSVWTRRLAFLLLASWNLLIPLASAAGERAPWLHLAAPEEGETLVSLPLVEVRGFVGAGRRPPSNIVVLIDLSRSTLLPAGFDVDLDGKIGKRTIGSRRSRYSTDPGDTIVRANLLGAEILIEDLARSETRIGLVTFWERARIYADLGPAFHALDALSRLSVRREDIQTRTNLARGLRTALHVLAEQSFPLDGDSRIVVFSDGDPTYPSPAVARQRALRVAQDAAASGVYIDALEFGVTRGPGVLSELARITGGVFVSAQQRNDYTALLPIREAAPREVLLANGTSDEPGRLVRVFPDGSFDGYVRLIKGRNEVEVTARLNDGTTLSASRTVYFDSRPARDVSEMRRIVELRNNLSHRHAETELATRAGRGTARTKGLQMQVEEDSWPQRSEQPATPDTRDPGPAHVQETGELNGAPRLVP